MSQPGPDSSPDPDDRPWDDVSRFPTFVDHLENEGAFSVREIIANLDVEIPVDGIVYHDRGIRVPGYDATFVHEPSRGRPAFSLEVDTVGPRNAWAVFDAQLGWDLYLLRTEGVSALAWGQRRGVQDRGGDALSDETRRAGRGAVLLRRLLLLGQRLGRTRRPDRGHGRPRLPQTRRRHAGDPPEPLGVLRLHRLERHRVAPDRRRRAAPPRNPGTRGHDQLIESGVP